MRIFFKGMSNEGGHGSSSTMEVNTPALFVSDYFKEFVDCGFYSDLNYKNLHDKIKTREQIDLVSTLCCLFDLEIPENNRGVSFLNDIFGSKEKINDKEDLEVSYYKCWLRNLNQLNRKFDLVNDIKLVENFTLNAESSKKLRNINIYFNKFIRQKINELSDDKQEKNEQSFNLILGLLLISIVRYFTLKYTNSCLLN
jgi:hypothetical protein